MDFNDDDHSFGFLAPLELKFADAASSGEFTGYGAAFDNVDSHGDVIRRGAFSASIFAHKAAGTAPALLWSHNQSRPVGTITHLQEDDRGLRTHGKLNLSTSGGRDAYGHLKEGSSRGLSIGYTVPPGGAQRGQDGVRVLSKLNLHEISLTPLPSNSHARVMGVKSLASPQDLERLLRDGGLSRRAAEKIAGPGFAALTGSATSETKELDIVAAILRDQASELKTMNKDYRYGNR